MIDQCDPRGLMERHGVRYTPVRMAVLEILAASPRALRAGEILDEVRVNRRVNKVTIYRVLDDFTQRGVVRRLPLEGRAFSYELACEHNPPHPHFRCRHCGGIQCLDPVPMDRVWAELRGPLGNRVEGLEIRVEGVCLRCREMPL